MKVGHAGYERAFGDRATRQGLGAVLHLRNVTGRIPCETDVACPPSGEQGVRSEKRLIHGLLIPTAIFPCRTTVLTGR